MRLIILLTLLAIFASCKPVSQYSISEYSESDSDNISYQSEDVKWIGYFEGFASIQEPLSSSEGTRSAGRSGKYTWKGDIDNFAQRIENSDCGSNRYDSEFEKFFADRLRRNLGYYELADFMINIDDCQAHAKNIAKFLRSMKGKRGADLHELNSLFLLSRFSKMFYMQEVAKLENLNFSEMPDAIFTDKTTPSLDFNNEVAQIISERRTWEELGLSPDTGLMGYYGGKFYYENKDSILFQISPLGALFGASESLQDFIEGRDAQGNSTSRYKSGALLAANIAIATLDALAIKVGAAKGFAKVTGASRRITSKAKSLKSSILRQTLSKDEVADFQRVITTEIEGLGRTAKVAAILDDAAIVTIKGKTMVNLAKSIPGFSEDVFLGFEKGHAMMFIKGRRVDAGPLLLTKVKPRVGAVAKQGMFFRLNLDDATKASLYNNLDTVAKKRAWTCSNGACQMLSEHGNLVLGKGSLIENFRPSSVAKAVMDGKLTYKTGVNAGKVVDFDIFITPGKSIPNFIKELAHSEISAAAMFAPSITLMAIDIEVPELFYTETLFQIIDGDAIF